MGQTFWRAEIKSNWIKEEDLKKPDWLQSFGTYNTMPTPFVEIHWHEYVHAVRTNSVLALESRSLFGKPYPGYMDLQISWIDEGAYGVLYPNKWNLAGEAGSTGSKFQWEQERMYFRFGCIHDMVEIKTAGFGPGRMYFHTYECSKCGYTYTVDSSD